MGIMTGTEKNNKRRLRQGTYLAYTDGSLFEGGVKAGAGWVILCAAARRTVRFDHRRIGEAARGTSTIAEIYAAASALSAIARGSHITLHTDDRDLCAVLQSGDLPARIRRNQGKPALQNAYCTLFNQVARHRSVHAVKTHIDESPFLRHAHHLAREGAFLPPPRPL